MPFTGKQGHDHPRKAGAGTKHAVLQPEREAIPVCAQAEQAERPHTMAAIEELPMGWARAPREGCGEGKRERRWAERRQGEKCDQPDWHSHGEPHRHIARNESGDRARLAPR